MKLVETGIILKNTSVAPDIYDMTIRLPEISALAVCGQFVEVYPDNGVNLLARPISICQIGDGTLRFVFQAVGAGTRLFSSLKAGQRLRVLGPCGNGYPISEEKKFILVGGGIGVPPLLETACRLKDKGEVDVFLGFRSGSFLREDFENTGANVYIASDDGSAGFKGNVVGLMESAGVQGDVIYSCGPRIMLKAVAEYAEKRGIKAYVSMEERMACGIGACVGCTLKIKDGNGISNKKVCKDGPVFDSREVVWQ